MDKSCKWALAFAILLVLIVGLSIWQMAIPNSSDANGNHLVQYELEYSAQIGVVISQMVTAACAFGCVVGYYNSKEKAKLRCLATVFLTIIACALFILAGTSTPAIAAVTGILGCVAIGVAGITMYNTDGSSMPNGSSMSGSTDAIELTPEKEYSMSDTLSETSVSEDSKSSEVTESKYQRINLPEKANRFDAEFLCGTDEEWRMERATENSMLEAVAIEPETPVKNNLIKGDEKWLHHPVWEWENSRSYKGQTLGPHFMKK